MAEPLLDQPFAADVTSSSTAFHGRIWDVRRDTIDYNGSEIVREYVDHTGAVAVLAINDNDQVLLIRQYRHPIAARDWEIPAGLLDIAGEPTLAAAQRELAEEVDLVASQWNVLLDVNTSPGGSSERVRIFLARGLSDSPAFARADEELDIEKRWVPLDDAVDAFLARDIENAILGMAVLAAKEGRATGWTRLGPAELPWTSRHHS